MSRLRSPLRWAACSPEHNKLLRMHPRAWRASHFDAVPARSQHTACECVMCTRAIDTHLPSAGTGGWRRRVSIMKAVSIGSLATPLLTPTVDRMRGHSLSVNVLKREVLPVLCHKCVDFVHHLSAHPPLSCVNDSTIVCALLAHLFGEVLCLWVRHSIHQPCQQARSRVAPRWSRSRMQAHARVCAPAGACGPII